MTHVMHERSPLAYSRTLPGVRATWNDRRRVDPWPQIHLDARELLINNADERVYEGVGRGDERVVVSVRDLGEDVSASLWMAEVERLRAVSTRVCPAAAEVLDARIHGDRFVVVTTRRVPGEPLRTRLWRGPLTSGEAAMVLRDALELCVHLHGLGLSAAGTWLRTGILSRDAANRRRCVMTAYGTHVDNDVDPVGELHELAIRVVTTVGGRFVRGELGLPHDALAPAIAHALRRALGLVGRPFITAQQMLDEILL